MPGNSVSCAARAKRIASDEVKKRARETAFEGQKSEREVDDGFMREQEGGGGNE